MSTTFFKLSNFFSWGCETPVFSMVSGSAALRWCWCCSWAVGRDRVEVRTLCHRATLCPVWCVPGCGWAVTPSDRLRGCVGFCGGCGGAFLIQWYLRPPCAPVVPCGGSVCPLRGSDGVPCPAPPLRTICRPAWPVVRPVASVGSVCGVGWVSASPPPIAPPVPSHSVPRSRPGSAPAHPAGITTAAPASPPPAASISVPHSVPCVRLWHTSVHHSRTYFLDCICIHSPLCFMQ